VPVNIWPTLWYHKARHELLQGFGGLVSAWTYGTVAFFSLSLWSLRIDRTGRNGTWAEVLYTADKSFAGLARPVGGLTAYANGSAYVLGGYASGQEQVAQNRPLPGLVHYNMSSRVFANASAAPYYGSGAAHHGQMVHVLAFGGAAGLFVMLGGLSSRGLLSFGNITLYHPATQRWYWQEATGEAPRRREEFCAAGALSTNGMYEM
jgi:hypothetical protein